MELSSSKFKALAVSAGFSLWFFIISNAIGIFSIELMASFVAIIIIVTQIFAVKLSKLLDIFAIYNTKIFLGILFVIIISLYGILFRVLRIDLLRLQKQQETYWLDIEQLKVYRIFKQY
jgi:alpha-glucuronidase